MKLFNFVVSTFLVCTMMEHSLKKLHCNICHMQLCLVGYKKQDAQRSFVELFIINLKIVYSSEKEEEGLL